MNDFVCCEFITIIYTIIISCEKEKYDADINY